MEDNSTYRNLQFRVDATKPIWVTVARWRDGEGIVQVIPYDVSAYNAYICDMFRRGMAVYFSGGCALSEVGSHFRLV